MCLPVRLNIVARILFLALLAAAPNGSFAATLEPADSFSSDILDIETGELENELSGILKMIQEGNAEAAITALEFRNSNGADGATQQELLGIAYAKVGRISESLKAFEKSLEFASDRSTTYSNLGRVQDAIGDFDAAKANFETAIALNPQNRHAHQILGTYAEAKGEWDQAVKHYEKGIKGTPPTYIGIKANLALIYLRQGNPEKVLPILQRWEIMPGAPDFVLQILADTRIALNQPGNAQFVLEKMAIRNSDSQPYIQLSRISISNKDFRKAEEWLNKAKSEFPDDVGVQFELGNLFGAQGRYEDALKEYANGLQLAPDNAFLLHASSVAQFRRKEMTAATNFAVRAMEQEPNNAKYVFWLATVQEANGATDAAIALYEKTIGIAPGNWIALNNLSALVVADNPELAVDLATRASELAPDVAAVMDTLAWATFKSGDISGAEEILADVVNSDPNNVTATYRLGVVMQASGKNDTARSLMERALTLDPDFKYAREARKMIADL